MLTDAKIKAAKPGYNPNINRKTGKPHGKTTKPYKCPKENGLYLIVYPNGRKGWRHSITVNGLETLLAYGNYPEVSLKFAREKRDETRLQLARGVNVVAQRQAERQARADTFEAIAREWLEAKCPPHRKRNGKTVVPDPDTINQLTRRLEKYVFPYHGRDPIKSISVQDLHQSLRRILSKGKIETAHRVRSVTSRIFRYAVATGRAERDQAADLKDALPGTETQSFAAITDPKEIGGLMLAIADYEGQPSVVAALNLAPYVFVRPSELRNAEWSEIDFGAAEWRIPAEKTKMNRPHLVPLSKQAVAILDELHQHTGTGTLVFPGIRSRKRPISENTLNGALRRLGYTSDQMTTHGFRSMASTRLNELRFDPDLIEVQLAHMDKDRIRAIYNRINQDSYKAMRRTMMQSWADYLDGLKADKTSKVVAIRG